MNNKRFISAFLVLWLMVLPVAIGAEPFILDMVHHNPGEAATQTQFLDPQLLSNWGFNGQVLNDYVQAAVTYESFDPDLFAADSEAEAWRKSREEQINSQIKKAVEAGIGVYYFTDFIVFPKELINKYKKKICNSRGEIDIHKKLTQQLVRISIREIFERFPQIDGLVVRTGEVYSHNVPYHLGNNPILKGVRSHKILLQIMREEIAVKLDKKLIYRTWDFGLLHTHARNYKRLASAIEPHKNLIFSIKHTNGDFHRTELFNTTIALGKHPQLIEIQCQREYEGKGAHPNYIMEGVVNGFEELRILQEPGSLISLKQFKEHPLYAGIWTWTRGGGWQGPYIDNEFWCSMNAWIAAQWALDPKQSEEEIFNRFGLKFGFEGDNLKKLRKIALLSADGVIRGRASTEGKINVWWTRDHYIGAPPAMTQKALEEKSEAVLIWREIEALAGEIDIDDKVLQDFIRVSCSYGRIKYEIFEKSWKIIALDRNGQGTGSEVKMLIAEYDALWDEYRKLKADNPACPTLYRDTAMGYEHNVGAFDKPGIGAAINKLR